jgi:Protein of unknown function (DUF3365)
VRSVTIIGLAVTSILGGCSKPASEAPQPAAPPAEAVVITTQLQEAVRERGRLIASETFSLLSSNLQSAISTGGVTNALPYCSLAASPLTVSVGDRYGVTLRRITQRARNPKDKANSAEAEILDQYRIELSRSNALMPIVTNLQDGSLTFFAPIVLTNALCLKCHGEPGRDIAPDHLEVIHRLYPQDEAVGFQLGELRGAWRIDFPATALKMLDPRASH